MVSEGYHQCEENLEDSKGVSGFIEIYTIFRGHSGYYDDDGTRMQGIVVKVVHKKLYSLQKGVVEGVEDQFTALVRILDTGDKVKFDQAHLESVIPAIGNVVLLYSIPVSV